MSGKDYAVIAGFDAEEHNLLFMDGFDDCIVGVVERFGQPPILCYDRNKVVEELMDQGMTYDEGQEYFEFNQIGAGMGDNTPCFLSVAEEIQ